MAKGKITGWLSAGWWAGVGVIVALAAPLAVEIYKSSVGPTPSQFETDLRGLSSEDDLVLKMGVTLELSEEQSRMRLRKFKLETNSVLVLPASADSIEIFATEAELQTGAQIMVKHEAAANGPAGGNGRGGSDCRSGGNGLAGKNGQVGSSAPSLSINVIDLILDGNIRLDLSGGNGGVGGKGGAGGSGGRADRSDRCRGGNGGNGGTGGDGGNGGDGGTLTIRYVNGLNSERDNIGDTAIRSSFVSKNSGGGKGLGGGGGAAGGGGAGRGAAGPLGLGAQPGGSNGSGGASGKDGKSGMNGGEINLIHESNLDRES